MITKSIRLAALPLEPLRVFVSMVDRGSFRAVAGWLGQAQPSLSAEIANRESELRLSLRPRRHPPNTQNG
ncbi:LysR family transcriptional regulator [Variovorax paradoxus]|uniref:LysR family transcriptional regulator n=1 Tax=Variovorax paradoxus TaxID=34073 RepID=A0A5Q0M5I1_VARPD|nr:LysR family transcriptional regulator [Variovorax paradoxus]QFZ84901.1 LysR family transcriptional regulator [Variovorax paradoxus]